MKRIIILGLVLCSFSIIKAQMSSMTVRIIDKKVFINLYAPNASDAKIVGNHFHKIFKSDTVPLIQRKGGVWSDTFKTIPAGFYEYRYLVDGAQFFDFQSPICFSGNTWKGCIEVPDVTDSFSIRKTGPFGSIEQNLYKSSVTGEYRKCQVYLPAEYQSEKSKLYKTVYLFADWGENEDAWITQGRVNDVLDNAINSGIAEPCIIIMENKNTLKHRDSVKVDQSVANSILVNDLVPYIDSMYRTEKNASSRIVAGCFEGSVFAAKIASGNPTVFKSLGMFGLPKSFTDENSISTQLKSAGLDKIWLVAGDNDSNYASVLSLHNKLDTEGVSHTWKVLSGSDNWLTWRRGLLNMLKK